MKIYRDRDGDLWACTDSGRMFLAVGPTFIWAGPVERPLAHVEQLDGPLSEMGAEEAAQHHRGLFDLFDRLTGLPDLPRS